MAKKATEIQAQEAEKQKVIEGDAERTRERVAFVPRADIYETDEGIVVVADVPGVDEKSVTITLENDVLSIDACVAPEEVDGYGLAYAEYQVGDYQRKFTVSNRVDRDGIKATVKNGVLHLHLPKAQPATRQIAVKAG